MQFKELHSIDVAEDLKKENRKLRVEMNEKIEAVRRFWRNCILEEKVVLEKWLCML